MTATGSDEQADDAATAQALLDEALALDGTGREDEELSAYAAIVAQFGARDEPAIRGIVGWALWNQIYIYDERADEARAAELGRELVARRAEDHDATLAVKVAWCMEQEARRRGEAGDVEGRITALRDLVDRFAAWDRSEAWTWAVDALLSIARELEGLGRHEEVVAVCDDLASRWSAETKPDVRASVIIALCHKASALDSLGRPEAALDTYDEAVGLGAEGSDATVAAAVASVLTSKALTLDRAGREHEALVVYDSAVTIAIAHAADAPGIRDDAVFALLEQARVIGALEGAVDPAPLLERLHALTGLEPRALPQPTLTDEPPEDAVIASLLADATGPDWWLELATAGAEEVTRERMATRALELYRATRPWLEPPVGEWDAAAMAATAVRQIADGFALLARAWAPEERRELPLPSRLGFARALRMTGLDAWAEELGHPLTIEPADDEGDETPWSGDGVEPDDDDAMRRLACLLAAELAAYELLETLCASADGRRILAQPLLRWHALGRLWMSRRWVAWATATAVPVPVHGALAVLTFVAEAWVVAALEDPAAEWPLLPRRDQLRDLLAQAGVCDWLDEHGVQVADWLLEDED